jgi:ATP-dependent DNA helicase RecG
MQMGRGEELGSGVLNVNKYLPFYTKGAKPRFVEGDPFVTIIPLPSATSGETTQKTTPKTSEKTSEKLLALISGNANVSARELADAVGLTSRAVEMQLRSLRSAGRLRRIGPDKGGHWEVVKM